MRRDRLCAPLLVLIALLLGAAASGCGADAGGGAGEGERDRRVLVVGIDDVRTDVLARAQTPHIDSLVARGYYRDDAQTRMPTVSGPGWSSMLTGVWSEKHGVTDNSFEGKDYDAYPDFLTRLERADTAHRTFAATDWPPLATTAGNGPLVGPAVDVRAAVDGDRLGYRVTDSLVTEAAAAFLSGDDPHATFVYLGNVDVVGHETGSLSPEYAAAVERADAQVGRLVQALRERPSYADEDWLILMSTDHGRRDDGGHGGDSELERRIFFLASGPGVRTDTGGTAPPAIVDVAATALAYLGVTSGRDLDGRPAGLER